MKTVVIYDDTGRKSEVITDIIGSKGFADVVIRKRRLEEYYQEEIRRIFPDKLCVRILRTYQRTGTLVRGRYKNNALFFKLPDLGQGKSFFVI